MTTTYNRLQDAQMKLMQTQSLVQLILRDLSKGDQNLQQDVRNNLMKFNQLSNQFCDETQEIINYHQPLYEQVIPQEIQNRIRNSQNIQQIQISQSKENILKFTQQNFKKKMDKIENLENLKLFKFDNDTTYLFIWRNLFFVEMKIAEMKIVEKHSFIKIEDINCRLTRKYDIEQDIKQINEKEDKCKFLFLAYFQKFLQSAQKTQNNSKTLQLIEQNVQNQIFENPNDLDLEIIFQQIISQYQYIFNPKKSICCVCQQHLKFHSNALGFLPPILIEVSFNKQPLTHQNNNQRSLYERNFFHIECLKQ